MTFYRLLLLFKSPVKYKLNFMDTPKKSLCSLERNYYELLLQKHNRRRSDQLRPIKLQILTKAIKKPSLQVSQGTRNMKSLKWKRQTSLTDACLGWFGLSSCFRGLIGIRVNFYHKDFKAPVDGLPHILTNVLIVWQPPIDCHGGC